MTGGTLVGEEREMQLGRRALGGINHVGDILFLMLSAGNMYACNKILQV